MLPIVDTHLHLWDLTRFSLPWLAWDGMELLRRNYLMSNYLETTAESNVSKAVYMEVDVDPAQRDSEAARTSL